MRTVKAERKNREISSCDKPTFIEPVWASCGKGVASDLLMPWVKFVFKTE